MLALPRWGTSSQQTGAVAQVNGYVVTEQDNRAIIATIVAAALFFISVICFLIAQENKNSLMHDLSIVGMIVFPVVAIISYTFISTTVVHEDERMRQLEPERIVTPLLRPVIPEALISTSSEGRWQRPLYLPPKEKQSFPTDEVAPQVDEVAPQEEDTLPAITSMPFLHSQAVKWHASRFKDDDEKEENFESSGEEILKRILRSEGWVSDERIEMLFNEIREMVEGKGLSFAEKHIHKKWDVRILRRLVKTGAKNDGEALYELNLMLEKARNRKENSEVENTDQSVTDLAKNLVHHAKKTARLISGELYNSMVKEASPPGGLD